MAQTTDIWFRTNSSLKEVALALGLQNPVHDAENYWEWVIGDFGPLQVDVTRTHTLAPGNVETRIFRPDQKSFGGTELVQLTDGLRRVADSPVCWGRWVYRSGNEFDMIEVGRTA